MIANPDRLRILSDDWTATADIHIDSAREAATVEDRNFHLKAVRKCRQWARECAAQYRAAMREARV